MNSELIKLKESVLSLTSELSDENIRTKLLHIEYLLSDFDFVNDIEEIDNLTPAQILGDSLEAPYLEITSQRVYFEWFAVLALYWLKKMGEIPLYKEESFQNCYHAHNLAQSYLEKAIYLEEKSKRQNRKKMAAVSKTKYTPNSILKALVFGEYEIAYEKLQREEKSVTYDAIIREISDIVQEHNKHPETGEKIIGLNAEKEQDDGVFDRTLKKWFGEGVRKGLLTPTRAK